MPSTLVNAGETIIHCESRIAQSESAGLCQKRTNVGHKRPQLIVMQPVARIFDHVNFGVMEVFQRIESFCSQRKKR